MYMPETQFDKNKSKKKKKKKSSYFLSGKMMNLRVLRARLSCRWMWTHTSGEVWTAHYWELWVAIKCPRAHAPSVVGYSVTLECSQDTSEHIQGKNPLCVLIVHIGQTGNPMLKNTANANISHHNQMPHLDTS